MLMVRIIGLLVALVIMAEPILAQDCPTHRVRSGDTLRKIAERYLGSRDRSPAIYRINRSVIGGNPDLIEPGMRLRIPCSRTARSTPRKTQPAKPAAPETQAQTAPASAPDPGTATMVTMSSAPLPPEERLIDSATGPALRVPGQSPMSAATMPDTMARPDAAGSDRTQEAGGQTMAALPPERREGRAPVIGEGRFAALTGGPFSPFSGSDELGGGLVARIVRAAFELVPEADIEIAMVNDRPSHLSTLLPTGPYSLSFPWVYPDCADPQLIPAERALCEGFIASDSLFELVTEFYARGGSDWASVAKPDDLRGARLCRPEGYPTTDLVHAGLLPDAVTLIPAATPEECIRLLDAGSVDVASLDAMVTRALVLQMDITNPLVVLEALTRFDRLRAVALRGDPNGEAAIAALNGGIAALGEQGDWYAIVQDHLRGAGG